MSCTSLELAPRWAEFLVRHYESDEAVMAAFQVSRRTVSYWLAQQVEPRARHLAQAMVRHPESIPLLIGAEDA